MFVAFKKCFLMLSGDGRSLNTRGAGFIVLGILALMLGILAFNARYFGF